ncbi:unnamed protein product [Polarella glacialis]|uniref:RRM domain-containing protein n=2 Tax=Polarella glacialis TaxID=89957 RepID=A0A813DVA5_POLGL|nr:unnamed protein product [Polarella glacialis]
MGCWEAMKGACPRKGKGKGCKWCQGAPDSAGKGKGKSFTPSANLTWQPQFMKQPWTPYDSSKGKGKDKGKGKGKGKNPARKVDNALKVWVGGLPATVSFKAMQAHFDQVGKTTWADPGHKGKGGCACYTTEQEVQTAVMMLNGSVLEGHTIQVDVWEMMPKVA